MAKENIKISSWNMWSLYLRTIKPTFLYLCFCSLCWCRHFPEYGRGPFLQWLDRTRPRCRRGLHCIFGPQLEPAPLLPSHSKNPFHDSTGIDCMLSPSEDIIVQWFINGSTKWKWNLDISLQKYLFNYSAEQNLGQLYLITFGLSARPYW